MVRRTLQRDGTDPAEAIQPVGSAPEAEVFKQTRKSFPTDTPSKEVFLASGRYLRVDFEVQVPPRTPARRLNSSARAPDLP